MIKQVLKIPLLSNVSQVSDSVSEECLSYEGKLVEWGSAKPSSSDEDSFEIDFLEEIASSSENSFSVNKRSYEWQEKYVYVY